MLNLHICRWTPGDINPPNATDYVESSKATVSSVRLLFCSTLSEDKTAQEMKPETRLSGAVPTWAVLER
jgi:hypothetical protein